MFSKKNVNHRKEKQWNVNINLRQVCLLLACAPLVITVRVVPHLVIDRCESSKRMFRNDQVIVPVDTCGLRRATNFDNETYSRSCTLYMLKAEIKIEDSISFEHLYLIDLPILH